MSEVVPTCAEVKVNVQVWPDKDVRMNLSGYENNHGTKITIDPEVPDVYFVGNG
jgi:hypothetical protein